METDEALLPLRDFLAEMTAQVAGFEDREAGVTMELESLGVEMPLVLDVAVREDGSIALAAAPPLYYVDTTIGQVYHPVKFTIVQDQTLTRQ